MAPIVALTAREVLSPAETLCFQEKRSIPGENALLPGETVYPWRKRSDSRRNALSLEKTV
jgi:hypothetical protein